MGACASSPSPLETSESPPNTDGVHTDTAASPAPSPSPSPSPAAPAPAPAPVPYAGRVMCFAILRNGHEGLRGLLLTLAERAAECAASPSADTARAARDAWRDFQTLLGYHMTLEDKGAFPMFNAFFDNVIMREGIDGEHVEDVEHQRSMQETLDALGADTPTGEAAQAVVRAVAEFQAHHLAHLEHEERVMMPLTQKVDPPAIRPALLNELLGVDWEAARAALPLNVREMARRNPYPSLRMLVLAVQRSTTPAQYAQLLPGMREAAGSDVWRKLSFDGCAAAGKLTDEDVAAYAEVKEAQRQRAEQSPQQASEEGAAGGGQIPPGGDKED